MQTQSQTKKILKIVSEVQFILLQFSCSYFYANVLGSMFNSNWKKKNPCDLGRIGSY